MRAYQIFGVLHQPHTPSDVCYKCHPIANFYTSGSPLHGPAYTMNANEHYLRAHQFIFLEKWYFIYFYIYVYVDPHHDLEIISIVCMLV